MCVAVNPLVDNECFHPCDNVGGFLYPFLSPSRSAIWTNCPDLILMTSFSGMGEKPGPTTKGMFREEGIPGETVDAWTKPIENTGAEGWLMAGSTPLVAPHEPNKDGEVKDKFPNVHSVEMKVQRNYLTIRLRRMGKKRCQRSPKKLSSRACFPLICNATPKHTYLWSGFTWPPKCEVTTRLKRMKRLD